MFITQEKSKCTHSYMYVANLLLGYPSAQLARSGGQNSTVVPCDCGWKSRVVHLPTVSV